MSDKNQKTCCFMLNYEVDNYFPGKYMILSIQAEVEGRLVMYMVIWMNCI
jgi:hypothetical protein